MAKELEKKIKKMISEQGITPVHGREIAREVLTSKEAASLDIEDVKEGTSSRGTVYHYLSVNDIWCFLPRDWDETPELHKGDLLVTREGPQKNPDGTLRKSLAIERPAEDEEEEGEE